MRIHHMLILLILCFSGQAFAEFNCKAGAAPSAILDDMGAQIEKISGEYKTREAAHKASLESRAKQLIDQGLWASSDESTFYAKVLETREFQDQESLKRQYNQQYMAALALAAAENSTDPQVVCEHATKVIWFLSKIVASSDEQWKFMASELARAAEAARAKGG